MPDAANLSKETAVMRTKMAIARWCDWNPKKHPELFSATKLDLLGDVALLRAFNNQAFADQPKFTVTAADWKAAKLAKVGDVVAFNQKRLGVK
ncbi:MAG TPA: hypothetical protein VFS60_06085 [Thermoanaerobaculia bacterium]|nr:hypothetical protein [Thermoanaerobaculia bacterium]